MDKKEKHGLRQICVFGSIFSMICIFGWLGHFRFEDTTIQMGVATTPTALEFQWNQPPELRLPGIVGKVSLNEGTQGALEALPGIGEKLAASIISYREKNGAFVTLEDMMKVSGIGEKKFEKVKAYITIDSVDHT